MPHLLLEDTPERVVTAILPGVRGRAPAAPRADIVPFLAARRWATRPVTWHTHRVLRLTQVGAAHSLDLFWDDATDRFVCWYVNLQSPLRRSRLGFDTLDHVLDLVVEPDGGWHWKDEEEFEAARHRGLLTPAEAEAIRVEGERVAADLSRLLPTGWETWRPPPGLPRPALPPDWHRP
jgi:very-short-patch-repair endonuclease